VATKKNEIQVSLAREGKGEFKAIGGSAFDDFNRTLATELGGALWLAHTSQEERASIAGAALSGLIGIKPTDEIEGMLGAQMIATHKAAMECFRRAMLEGQTFEGRNQNLGFANKLVRSCAALVEALDRHRGKGQQKVTVEHVHVHQGGRAIVGNVTPGGGARLEFEELSHEQKAALPVPDVAALPCAFEADEAALPQSGSAR
jgi:hypothetical protein